MVGADPPLPALWIDFERGPYYSKGVSSVDLPDYLLSPTILKGAPLSSPIDSKGAPGLFEQPSIEIEYSFFCRVFTSEPTWYETVRPYLSRVSIQYQSPAALTKLLTVVDALLE